MCCSLNVPLGKFFLSMIWFVLNPNMDHMGFDPRIHMEIYIELQSNTRSNNGYQACCLWFGIIHKLFFQNGKNNYAVEKV